MAASAWARRLAEVPELVKKRPTRGWRKEWKTIWAPLVIRSDVYISLNSSGAHDLLGLGEGHPQYEDELENVVEG